MENKVKMKAMLKQMQSVIALVIIFVVASVVCVKGCLLYKSDAADD